MEIIKAKLMSLSVYKNILDTKEIKALLELCDARTPEALIRCYSSLVNSVWEGGHYTLGEAVLSHLKYDDSFIGNLVAKGEAPEFMMEAAAMDIRRLASISQLSCAGMKRNMYDACSRANAEYGAIVQNLAELPIFRTFTEDEVFQSYRINGCGEYARGRAFRYEKGNLIRIRNLDPISSGDMIDYLPQRKQVEENTRALHAGAACNNVLLYGDSGTGKSATVKSLINDPEFYNLRLIEIAKNSLDELTLLTADLGRRTQKFIIYIDDLSFEKEDKGFSALKTALEGGLECRPSNVAIYATSNRRHLIRESFSDRQGDDVHAKETLEERTSLAERFGIRIAYLSLDKKRYNDMVLAMCRSRGVMLSEDAIIVEANRWEIRHGGRTPRTACQLVDKLVGDMVSGRSAD